MKVKELQKLLDMLNREAEVFIFDSKEKVCYPIESITFNKEGFILCNPKNGRGSYDTEVII